MLLPNYNCFGNPGFTYSYFICRLENVINLAALIKAVRINTI